MREKRKEIDRSVEVIVANNTERSRIVLDSPRTNTVIDLSEFGEEDYLSVEDLKIFINQNRKVFEELSLLIVDVVGDDSLMNVAEYVGLGKTYKALMALKPNQKDDSVSVEDITNFVIKSNVERFSEVLQSKEKGLVGRIVHRSIQLFREQEFNDYIKMKAVSELVKDDDLFADIDESMAVGK